MGADAEQRADHDREDVVDDRVGPRQHPRERAALEPRLGEDVEDDVEQPRHGSEPDVRDEARLPRTTRRLHPGPFIRATV